MQLPIFTLDFKSLYILLGILLLFFWLKQLFQTSLTPRLYFSKVADLKFPTFKTTWAFLPKRLLQFALLLFLIAFMDPTFFFPKTAAEIAREDKIRAAPIEVPTEGVAIYLVLDQSGSMAAEVTVVGLKGQSETLPKIDFLKQISTAFIKNRPSDLIGLLSFARIPTVLAPLTLDHETLLKQIEALHVVKNSEEDGTSMGYAIFKTANLIAATRHFAEELSETENPAYKIKNTLMIVFTDGFQDPSYLDKGNRLRTIELDEAAAFAKSQNIRLYIVNVDPKLSSAGYEPQRKQMIRITELTGGKFYQVTETSNLNKVYQNLNQLEKGIWNQPIVQPEDPYSKYNKFSLYPFLIAFGLVCLCASFILEMTIFRRIP